MEYYRSSQFSKCNVQVEAREDLSKFCNIENINSVDTCVTHQFEISIFQNKERYVTKLQFKPDQDVTPDNFRVCEKCLRNLNKKLVQENSFDDYNGIFAEYERKKIIEKVFEEEIVEEPSGINYLPRRAFV